MHNLFLVLFALGLSSSVALAQGKVDSQWNCGKPSDAHSIDVGDQPGHAYLVAKISCTASKGEIEGQKEKDGMVTEFGDVKGNSSRGRGVFVDTLASGDKLYVSYQATYKFENGQLQSASNAWTITNGSGKFKGAKGKGTCAGKGNADGSATYDCTGEYTLAK